MQIAYTRYMKTLCPGCGLPSHVGRNEDNVGRWEVDEENICFGCEAIESHDMKTKYPGQKLHLIDTWA